MSSSEKVDYTQWLKRGTSTFIPTDNAVTVDKIDSGVYNLKHTQNMGFYLYKKKLNLDTLTLIPSKESEEVMTTVKSFWEREEKFKEYGFTFKRGILLYGPPGCHAKGTKVIMFDGTFKLVEDVQVGDFLMGPDSKPREVLQLCKNKEEMVRIKPSKGEEFTVNKNHILHLQPSGVAHNGITSPVNITVENYINTTTKCFKDKFKLLRGEIKFDSKELPIPPYILGLWLGDGTTTRPAITTIDKEIEEVWCDFGKKRGLVENVVYGRKNARVKTISLVSKEKTKGKNSFLNDMNSLAILGNKHIPHIYKTSSREQRLELLAGLVDTDGYTEGNIASKTKMGCGIQYTTKLKALSEDIIYLCMSLGFYASCNKLTKACYVAKKKVFEGEYYCINISGDLNCLPVRLSRKKPKVRKMNKDVKRTGFKYEMLGVDDYYGFVLDKDHLYLTSDFIIHHNTGKTSIINLVTKYLVENKNGVVFILQDYDDLDLYRNYISEVFRVIEPNRPILTVIEDIDGLCNVKLAETKLINILDGIEQIDNVLYIATTNYLEKLSDRLTNRPNRFDRRIKIGFPTVKARRFYISTKLTPSDLSKINLKTWVEKTEGMTISHIGELIKSVIIMGNDFQETIDMLIEFKNKPSSFDYNKNDKVSQIGFASRRIKLIEVEDEDEFFDEEE